MAQTNGPAEGDCRRFSVFVLQFPMFGVALDSAELGDIDMIQTS